MAELNLTQPDPLDDQSSLYINRQLRDKPGGTLLRLEGGQATIMPILADLPSATPRRAAFDSWKNRIKQFTGGMNDALDEQAPFELRYLSDINPETSVEHPDPMRWPTGLTNVKLLFEGQAAPRQFALTGGGRYASDAPANLWQSICVFFQKHFSWLPFINSYDPWSYEMFAFNTEADDYLKLRRMADRTARIPCTVSYPADAGAAASAEFDQSDPWRFEVTVELSGAWGTLRDIPILGALGKALSPTYSGLKVIRTEFPEFGKRIERMSYSHPFGAEPGQAPAGPNPPSTGPQNPGPQNPGPQNPAPQNPG